VAGLDPAKPLAALRLNSELALRIASGLVLAPLAVAIAYVGGWPFAVFWGTAAMIVLWEWTSLVADADRRAVLMAGLATFVLALLLAQTDHLLASVIVAIMGSLGAAALAPNDRRIWVVAGVPYAGAIALAPVILRDDPEYGFIAIVFLYAVVWSTDIAAYFAGRAIGGPKLMPRVSPKKTWSGAVGGTVAAVIVALIVARVAGLAGFFAIALIAVVLSILAQIGDLFESFLKRRFGVKDSGHLIPGHGGLMDRLDGFVTVAVLAVLIGLLRGGFETPGRGLVVW
jgi:phosphatidate cytidylyltransferase